MTQTTSRIQPFKAPEAHFALIDEVIKNNCNYASRNAFINDALEEFISSGLADQFFDDSPFVETTIRVESKLFEQIKRKKQASDFIRAATRYKLYTEKMKVIPLE